jgi:hypothetical protein
MDWIDPKKWENSEINKKEKILDDLELKKGQMFWHH